ncbi:unnamed protein product [Arctia plantaginis]|uniref:Uncharacterized protein n=1 Tax=Arctia plantaginis TaxID=874455 RepID=A0A8S0ZS29_ARCPL|nr:unnamed protein product [Arctia plantaginis]CAB3242052.1 unnamed protein product [Arctia plantaginis]
MTDGVIGDFRQQGHNCCSDDVNYVSCKSYICQLQSSELILAVRQAGGPSGCGLCALASTASNSPRRYTYRVYNLVVVIMNGVKSLWMRKIGYVPKYGYSGRAARAHHQSFAYRRVSAFAGT